jgi:hypothetical protein
MDNLVSVEANLLGSKEPDFSGIAMFDNIEIKWGIIEDSVFTSALEIVASNISLGDTNTAIPGRILGCLDIYEEENASQYVWSNVLSTLPKMLVIWVFMFITYLARNGWFLDPSLGWSQLRVLLLGN